MASVSYYSFLAALITLAAALVFQLAGEIRVHSRLSFAGAGSASVPLVGAFPSPGQSSTLLAINTFIFLTASLLLRAIATRHGPFTNMFEFSEAFAWGILALYLHFHARYRLGALALLVLPVAFGLLVFAATVPDSIEPLVPALRNQPLLTLHVMAAVIAYGAFTVAFGAAVLYLVQRKDTVGWLPRSQVLDEVAYRAVIVGFPMLALVILLGAIWAETAWGTYWSWDPKETASLATWLVYGAYLHARVVREWRGRRSALLLIGGFGATMFTYYGNLFLGGMHTYA
jgi:cytochrome c-type biogenesis protein CcsB